VSCIPKNTQSTFGTRLLHLTLVPPLPFLPASAVYSAHQTTGLLHPAADHGVRHVSGPLIRSPLSPTLHIRRPAFSTKTQPRSLERARRQTPTAPLRLSTNRRCADPLSTVQPESCPAFMSPGDLSIPKDFPADPCDHTGDFHSLWRLYPSKLFPRHQPYPVTAVSRVHRRPLPPRRSHSRLPIPAHPLRKGHDHGFPPPACRPRGFTPMSSPLHQASVAADSVPVASMGLSILLSALLPDSVPRTEARALMPSPISSPNPTLRASHPPEG